MTKDIIKQEQLITKKFSIAMKDKNMSVDEFYSRIRENAEITFEAMLKERLGFWKCGQLLNKAKSELRQGFKKLQRRLINDKILSLRQQQRFMKISSSKRISKIIMRLPPYWTFAEWIDSLPDNQYKLIEDKINRKVEKNELLQVLPQLKNSKPVGRFNPLRNEILSILIDENKIDKQDNEKLKRFVTDIKKLTKKYSFLEYFEKDYLKQTYEYLSGQKLRDDTKMSKKKLKNYNSKTKINL